MLRNSHQSTTTIKSSQASSGAFKRAYNRGLRVRRLSAYRHTAIQGTATSNKALYLKAPATSPFSSAWMARWLPQPGHLYPVNFKMAHCGNSPDCDGSSE